MQWVSMVLKILLNLIFIYLSIYFAYIFIKLTKSTSSSFRDGCLWLFQLFCIDDNVFNRSWLQFCLHFDKLQRENYNRRHFIPSKLIEILSTLKRTNKWIHSMRPCFYLLRYLSFILLVGDFELLHWWNFVHFSL